MWRSRSEPGPDASWLLLVVFTALGIVAYRFQSPPAAVTVILLSLALLKARVLCVGFLGLGSAPAGWRRGIAIGVAWVLALALLSSDPIWPP